MASDSDSDISINSNDKSDCDDVKDVNEIYTVKELNEMIKSTINSNMMANIMVQGEISNLKYSGNGAFLTLKDANSSIQGIMWNKKSGLKNGDLVIATGNIDFYTKSGSCNMKIHTITNIGNGDLHEKYMQLKDLFEKEGLFARKRTLPNNISRIAILTASEGAALQDILFVLRNNNYNGEIIVKNCCVQGTMCPSSVKVGVEYFTEYNKNKPIDVLILGRGGGSFEDLMGFSHKDVVKAINMCPIITISAVGHEVDFMLSDFAADIRAPTPSIAGEYVSSMYKTRRNNIVNFENNISKMKSIILSKISGYGDTLIMLKRTLDIIDPLDIINNKINMLKSFESKIYDKITQQIQKYKHNVDKLDREQNNYDYNEYMKKGYSIVMTSDGNLINSKDTFTDMIKSKQKLKILFSDGEVILN